jgi:Tol biopolymer transport system component
MNQIGFYRSDQLYVMNSDGDELKELTKETVGNFMWSPDSAKIVFVSYEDRQIHIVDIETQDRRRLTNSKGCKQNPVWSPDGQKIAFYNEPQKLDHKLRWKKYNFQQLVEARK